MKKLFTLVLITLISYLPVKAQSVGYTYRPLAAEGCEVKYSVSKNDSSYYIVVTVNSDRMHFLNDPTMKIRTFNNDVLTLKGIAIGNGSESIGIVSGNLVIPVSEIISTAQFFATQDQFEQLKSGVSKIRISLTPMNHERSFKKDKIGKKLYKFYLKLKNQVDDF